MKAKLLLIIIAFSVNNIFAQTDSLSLKKDIDILNIKVENLESKIATIQTANIKILQENESVKNSQALQNKNFNQLKNDFEIYKQNAESQIDSLQSVIISNSANIQTTAKELGVKIDNTHNFTNQSITDLNNTVSQNTLYWIIAILVVAFFVLLVFVFLRKQIFKQKTDLDSNLQETRKALEEEGVKLDIKLAEMLEKQLIIINEERNRETKDTNVPIDHSLVLTIADRLIGMERNLSRMDEKTRGLNFLKNAILSIKDNFASNGYEIVEMIGKPYHSGMRADPTFDPDSKEESGIIIQIIKPQVNYKGEMIQSAQIIVSE
jgi:hypothetical protein